ncbi:MAG: YidC/Oxa1 family membrane protein insertase [Treponema sp.]|jgi:YidC/Oxa1 family membrane protein insertase|nr:YidC/Oxa1 family membrane protein insertase [Treponema sp.]
MGHAFYMIVIYPLTQIIELAFSFCNKLFDNTGIAVLGVSFAVSMLTLPLYIVAEHWQEVEREIEKRLKPEADKIKEVFRGDEQYMILSTYYRQNHYHPIMALRSSFGLLIQIPFFSAAYIYLSHLSALQGQHFLFIRNMGAPDALFTIGSFPVNVLPIAMTIINCISGAIYTKGLSLRDKLQVYGMALLFVVILYNSPAGLVLYWTMNNIFSLVKNVFYRLKRPLKTLYIILSAAVTILIVWLFAGHILSLKRALLVSCVFGLVYFAPLIVRFFNYLIDTVFSDLRDNAKKRFSLFLTGTIGICLLTGLLIPTLLVSSSPIEFSGIDNYGSPMFFVWNTFMQSVGFCIIWPMLIYFLYHERIQTLLAAGFAILFPWNLLNTFIFKGNYGILSKLLIFTTITNVDPKPEQALINILVLAAAAAAVVLLLNYRKQRIIGTVLGITALSLAGVSAVNIRSINAGYQDYKKLAETTNADKKTLDPIFHFSKTGKNVLMIYLDRAQNRFVQTIFDESPELYGQFSGFTLFSDAVSCNGHTLLGAPPCYGGYEYTPEAMNERTDEKLVDKQNEALLLLPRIFTEQAEGYSATCTDPSWANYSWIPDLSIYKDYPKIKSCATDGVYLDLWYKEHKNTSKITATSQTLKRNILWYSLFRQSPLVLRAAFYNQGSYWSADETLDDFDDFLEGYSVLDYLPRLTDFKATTPNTFISFVNNTTHDNLWLQAPDYVPVAQVTDRGKTKYKNSPSYPGNAASLKRVGTWFQLLKDNGVYDNTRIVIVADHGCVGKEDGYEWDEKFDKIQPGHYHPLLLFKDFDAKGDLVINHDFMANADVPTLLLQGLVPDAKNPYTGTKVDSSAKDKGILICTSNIFMPYQNDSKYVFTPDPDQWWRVKGNIFKSSSWTQEVQK